jgi:hypothetical protein
MKIHRVIRQKFHSAARLARKTTRTLTTEGPGAALHVLATATREYTPAGRRRTSRRSEFDERYGVDTSGVVRIASMEIASANYVHGVYYKATKADQFVDAIAGLAIRYEDFTFVDYGSGKGLTLLLASQFPFRKIIGVEFGNDLHRIAEQNIRVFRSPEQKCFDVSSVWADAIDFEPPAGPLLCYFYDPFEPPVLKQVMARLEATWKQNPRPLHLLYHGPTADSILHDANLLREHLLLGNGLLEKTSEWSDGTWTFYTARHTMA